MDAVEMMHYVDDISNDLLVLYEKREKEDVDNIIKRINGKITLLEDNSDLSKFASDTKKLLSIFESNPLDENKRSKSFLYLVSMISSERSRIIERYSLCSEPE